MKVSRIRHFLLPILSLSAVSSCSQVSSSSSLPQVHYHEERPLKLSLDIWIEGDSLMTVTKRQLEAFCARPADMDCWEVTRKQQKLSSNDHVSLIDMAQRLSGKPMIPNRSPGMPYVEIVVIREGRVLAQYISHLEKVNHSRDAQKLREKLLRFVSTPSFLERLGG